MHPASLLTVVPSPRPAPRRADRHSSRRPTQRRVGVTYFSVSCRLLKETYETTFGQFPLSTFSLFSPVYHSNVKKLANDISLG